MKKILGISLIVLTMLIVPAVARAIVPGEGGGCWLSGIGTIGCPGEVQHDSFGGNAMTKKDGSVKGSWTHISIASEVIFSGEVHYLVCKDFPSLPGPDVPVASPNYANFGGTGKLNGQDGYFFDVKVFDHAEPGIYRDRYSIDIYDENKALVYHADGHITDICHGCLDPSVPEDLAWVSDMGCISGGNFQIQPPNAGHPY